MVNIFIGTVSSSAIALKVILNYHYFLMFSIEISSILLEVLLYISPMLTVLLRLEGKRFLGGGEGNSGRL